MALNRPKSKLCYTQKQLFETQILPYKEVNPKFNKYKIQLNPLAFLRKVTVFQFKYFELFQNKFELW